MKKKLFLLLFSNFFLISFCLYSMDIQSIGVRNDNMGKTGAAVGSDIGSLYYNPANILLSPYTSLYFQYNYLSYNIFNQFVFGYLHLFSNDIAFALNLNVKNYSGLEEYDSYGDYIKNFSKQDNVFNIALAYKFQPQLFGGIKVKIANNSFYNYSSTFFYLDTGLLYMPFFLPNLKAGASIQNLQSGENSEIKDPFNIKLGLSYEWKLGIHQFLISSDYNSNGLIYPLYTIGLEYAFHMFRLGIGYNEKDKFTTGLGINYQAYRIDFGYIRSEIFDRYSLSATFYFLPPALKTVQSNTEKTKFTKKELDDFYYLYYTGLDFYYKDYYKAAVANWEKALAIDPGNKTIEKWIKKAEELLHKDLR